MLKSYTRVAAVASAVGMMFLFPGCYHAVIDTGLAPSAQTIQKDWAHGFLFGLVPPSPVETISKCPHGAAKVETQLSFLNQIANLLTFGIYTPMSITVTCAATGGVATNTPTITGRDAQLLLSAAVQASLTTGQPVNVQLIY